MAASTKTKIFTSLFLFALLQVILADEGAQVVTLTEDTWELLLDGHWMVEFYAPWCPACKSFEPKWKDYASKVRDLNVKVAKVDVTVNPALSGRFFITSLPTIYHVKDGIFRQYKGPRNIGDLVTLIEEVKYEDIEPLSWYQQPGSIPMHLLSWFFKASMIVRNVHEQITENYGIPVWGSYIIFAIFTIVMGLIFGLIIVCICDCICPPPTYTELPPPPPAPEQPHVDKKKEDNPAEGDDAQENEEESENIEEETEDDTPEGQEGLRQRRTQEPEAE